MSEASGWYHITNENHLRKAFAKEVIADFKMEAGQEELIRPLIDRLIHQAKLHLCPATEVTNTESEGHQEHSVEDVRPLNARVEADKIVIKAGLLEILAVRAEPDTLVMGHQCRILIDGTPVPTRKFRIEASVTDDKPGDKPIVEVDLEFYPKLLKPK